MSELRKHLQTGKAKHQAMRYPGDLANEIFAAPVMEYARRDTQQRGSLFKILAGSAAISAIAATIVVVVWLHHPAATVQKVYVFAPPPEEQAPFVLNTVPAMPTDLQIAPHDLGSLSPSYQSISVSSVPSFWDINSNSNSSDDSSSPSSSNAKEPT